MLPKRTTSFLLFALLGLHLVHHELHAQEVTVKVKSKGRDYIGQPLAYDGRDMVLMRRDGRISIIKVKNESEIKTISKQFKPYTSEAIRVKLQREFGKKYQVSRTRNFVVVHPPGDHQDWAQPFEVLYQRFRNYFSSRGFSVGTPQFPMVAVVLRSRKEFDKFLRTYHTYSPNTLGYYSQKSNRIITYDPSGGKSLKKSWSFHETLIHEAVHQSAFNVGIHKRFGFTPKWVLEGLACMFEARGLHSNMHHSSQQERINKNRLIALQHYYSRNRVQGKLASFIANDKIFDADPSVAYSYSWGLTFFLAEKYPNKFFKFLQQDAKREEFQDYSPHQRLAEFKRIFGNDIAGMEKRLEKFIAGLNP